MAGYVEKGVIRLHEKVGHDIWRMQILSLIHISEPTRRS